VAGNLGARPIQLLAGKVEKAISTKIPSAQLAAHLQELGSALGDFVNALRATLPPVESAAPPASATASVDPEQVKSVVQAMIANLYSFDPAAGECLEANREVFRALFPGEKFATFEQHVSGFAFADALALLEPTAKEKGLVSA
jgi:hypothetical protein